MKYGYARVSTDDQSTALQLAALKRAGCKTFFKDQGLSGATTKRPALLRCLKALEDGDTLIVWKLDRLGRSLRDLIAMLDDLKERGVKFRSLTEQIDTETPTGRAMWQMIGVLAELERSLISERTRAGVKAAQRRGVKFGRKPKLTPQQIAHARKLIDQDGLQGDSGNFGEYQQLVATWTPGNGNATNTYAYHIKVLGVYKQTQYNIPNENTCSGSPTAVTMWSSSGSGFSGAVLSNFDSRVTNQLGGTGSGRSIYFGGVQQEQTYSSGSGDLRRCASINGSIGSLGDSTIAVCHGRVNGALVNDPDLYVSGRNVYIRGEGVKTVADACVACCSDPVVTGSHSHFDNYTTDGACSGIPSLPSALSVILY